MASPTPVNLLTSIISTPIKHLKALISQIFAKGSIARGTQAAQVHPITIIDANLRYDERLPDTLHVFINMYVAIYLQAMALSNTTVTGAQIIKRLEKLNPTNTGGPGLGFESLDENEQIGVVAQMLPLNEEAFALPSFENHGGIGKPTNTLPNDTSGKPAAGTLLDVSELSVGKLFNIELRADGELHSIPVSFRLATTLATPPSLVKAMQNRFQSNETALERKTKYKTGSISGIMDLLFCRDLIRKHYQNLIADKDGVYSKLSPEKSKSYIRAFLTGEVTVAQASNVLVISQDTAERVEGLTGGKFSDKSFRTKMLEATGIMLLGIVDPLEDTVTVYIDSFDNPQLIPGRSLSRTSKKDGPDVNEVLRILVEGRGSMIR